MAGTILLCWFLNSGFLQKYYISNKKAVLMRMYEELGEAVANDEIDTGRISAFSPAAVLEV